MVDPFGIKDSNRPTPPVAGSVFINNTSYSGADIKVVVNVYDSGKSAKKQIEKYQDEIEKSDNKMRRNLSRIRDLED